MEKEIYIIRHGETDFNSKGIIQGRGVDSEINETGIKQSRLFFDHFSHIEFDLICTSSLKRTKQTIAPFLEVGYEASEHVELDEMHWGIHEGKTADNSLSKEYMHIINQWRAGILHEKIPGGESPLELQERQKRFIDRHLRNGSAKRILICSHGRAMRSFLCTLLQMDLHRMDEFPHRNLSLYKIIGDGERFELELFNYVDHLKALEKVS